MGGVKVSDGKKSVETEETTAKSDEIVQNDAVEAQQDAIEDAEIVQEPDESAAEPETAEAVEDTPVEEVPQEPAAEPEPVQQPAPAPMPAPRRSGFFGTVLGGVIAAGIGFIGSQYVGPLGIFDHGTSDETVSALRAQDRDIAELTTAFDTLKTELKVPDVSGAVSEAIAPVADQITEVGASLKTVTAQLSGLDARLIEVEKRPVGESKDISVAVSAYERELEAMRAELAAQRELNSQLSEGVDAAASAATATISRAAADAAVMRIGAALDSGAPFATAMSGLSSYDVPQALSAVAAEGVPSLAALAKAFSEPARAALAAAQTEAAAGGDATQKIGAFFRTQTGLRSTVPRDGDGADAVLSRAEAAVSNGALDAALSEIEKLPASAQDTMADWVAAATARLNAETALVDLVSQISGK